ncbi:PKD domain-containing protein [Candidatus Peregrinibacteria bacterium]|nr:PKD domain-containing protein [Candidatus Peregrinibacteria bacterium]
MKKFLYPLIIFVLLAFLNGQTFAYSGDLSINQTNISFSTNNILEGQAVRIYASVSNGSALDLLGVTRFTDNGNQIESDQAISIFAGKTDGVFVDWVPSYGNHKITVQIIPWEPEIDDPANNVITTDIYVKRDTDRDGIPNETDPDDDNDGVNDDEDVFPLDASEQIDTDGDTIGDNRDTDDDNDSVPDKFDDLPLDPNETMDTDKDGLGNVADKDDDNDGLKDAEEENMKTDPLLFDTDEDGASDKEDPFPLDPEEWADTDNDKIGNNADTDDDNDGIIDIKDEFPLNKAPVIKLTEYNDTIGTLDKYTFDASPSYDDDGKIVAYLWNIDNTYTQEGNSIKHTFLEPGEHNVELTLIDDQGEQINKNFQVSVVNLRLYKQLALLLFLILLALFIYLKYISEAEKSNRQ